MIVHQFAAMILSAFGVLLKIGKILVILKTFISHKARSSYVYNLHIVYGVASNTALKNRYNVEYIPWLHRFVRFFKTPCCCCCYLEKSELPKLSDYSSLLPTELHKNSLSTTFHTARAWWTQIWFTPLVRWSKGSEYVKSFAHSLKF